MWAGRGGGATFVLSACGPFIQGTYSGKLTHAILHDRHIHVIVKCIYFVCFSRYFQVWGSSKLFYH